MKTHGRYSCPRGRCSPGPCRRRSRSGPRPPPASGRERARASCPPTMKPRSTPSTISIHSALLVKTDVVPPMCSRNQRLDRELVHRVDLAFGRHACPLTSTLVPESGRGVLEIRMTFLTPTAEAENSITSMNNGRSGAEKPACPDPSRSTRRQAGRRSVGRRRMLPEPIARIGLRSSPAPLRFRLLQPVEPLIERFEPRVWWKLRNLAGLVLCHASPLCVAPAEIQGPDRGEKHGGKRHRQGAAPL